MTCQACQTWNADGDHRCRKCARRLRATPTRVPRDSYPIAATALAYEHEVLIDPAPFPETSAAPQHVPLDTNAQQILFAAPAQPRVIPFDQLTSPMERESIQARIAQTRPSPVRTGKVEVSPRRNKKTKTQEHQRNLDFVNAHDIIATPTSPIQCAAPVAPPSLRLNAALLDGVVIAFGSLLFLALFRLVTGELPLDRRSLEGYAAGLFAITLAYKLIWCFVNFDTFGMRVTGLRLVDLDGNPAPATRRLIRALSSFLSLGAVGLGLIWTFADPDGLAWHDQISGTFPTFSEE
jgi:uncharacterized RDD family membrane protein YckC